MLKVSSDILSAEDERYLRNFYQWVLNKFVDKKKQRNLRVKIDILSDKSKELSKEDKRDLRGFRAWMQYFGVIDGKEDFHLILNQNDINQRAKKPAPRLRKLLECLGHEMVHLKQYLNKEMVELDDNDNLVKFRGRKYIYAPDDDIKDPANYWFSPWELEAYGYEQGLFQVFKKLQQKQKS